jgi:hypothetical protein
MLPDRSLCLLRAQPLLQRDRRRKSPLRRPLQPATKLHRAPPVRCLPQHRPSHEKKSSSFVEEFMSQSSLPNPIEPTAMNRAVRLPILFFFASGFAWLLVASILWLLSIIQMADPNGWLAYSNVPWLTYGRVYPVSLDLLVYGSASLFGFCPERRRSRCSPGRCPSLPELFGMPVLSSAFGECWVVVAPDGNGWSSPPTLHSQSSWPRL